MYSSFQLARKYLRYYFTAMNGKGHGMHSPFVFNFILDVLNNSQGCVLPGEIEQLRLELLRDKHALQIEDLGAGSRTGATKQRTVAQLAGSAAKPRKFGELFYRLMQRYKPDTVLELGTSLGLTTAYIAKGAPDAWVHTIEGSEAVRAQALRNFEKLGIQNITAHFGNFDEVLPGLLNAGLRPDLVYIDGNHRYEPTVRYFHELLPHCSNNTILVFDDVHWSAEMERAWLEIQSHPSVRCTVDLFFLGFVFFRDEFKVPRHFTVRY